MPFKVSLQWEATSTNCVGTFLREPSVKLRMMHSLSELDLETPGLPL